MPLILPDAEEAVIRLIELAAAPGSPLAGVTVSAEPPYNLADVLPYVQVQREGGTPLHWVRHDKADLNLLCWHTNRTNASLLARQIHAVLHGGVNTIITDMTDGQPAQIGACTDTVGVTYVPDETDQAYARYTFSVTIGVYALDT